MLIFFFYDRAKRAMNNVERVQLQAVGKLFAN